LSAAPFCTMRDPLMTMGWSALRGRT
jgi:hypothetical protein